VRVIALLLAVLMMTGGLAQVVCASPDVAAAIDDAADVDVAMVPVVATVMPPPRRARADVAVPPSPAHGRKHAVLVFRPPRGFASR
jgi:hypothetical protein